MTVTVYAEVAPIEENGRPSTAVAETAASTGSGFQSSRPVDTMSAAGDAATNRPPVFSASTYAFELSADRDGRVAVVRLGAVTASDRTFRSIAP